jgi:hypothetical protein
MGGRAVPTYRAQARSLTLDIITLVHFTALL